jgi:hypothetical protein
MNRLALLLLVAAALPAQEVMSMSGDLANGLVVRIRGRIEPPLKGSKIPDYWGGIADDHDRVHRSVGDLATKTIFGYDLFAEPAGEPDRFLIRIEPLTKTMTEGRIVMLPAYPPSQIVREGDVIALDLLVSPDGKQKLVDYIEVGRKNGPASTGLTPRDFTFDDGPLTLRFDSGIHCFVNGRPLPDTIAFTVRRGSTIWFVIPGRGRYILSLSPQDGFQKAGAIRGHVVSFQDGPDTFEFRTGGPILGAGKAWNLYVFHDAMYQPAPALRSIIQGGVDRLDNLIRR